MTDEVNFGATHEQTKLAVLKEAVDRADNLASVQAQLITTQEQTIVEQRALITDLRERIKSLEGINSELKTALNYA